MTAEPDVSLAALVAAPERQAELFCRLTTATSPQEAQLIRHALVRIHLPLVEHCARRFANRGEPVEDLIQVGTIGLIKAVDRFDRTRGVDFVSYATPTILGEIKRHFRDTGWALRVPRRLQELRLRISAATADLTQTLGRAPTARELANDLGVTEEQVLEGLESANAYTTVPLDPAATLDDGDVGGTEDAALTTIDIRESIKPIIDQLGARERRILLLRFFKGMTQSQIAAELGMSQMHVSRLLGRTLERLRGPLVDGE